MLRGIRVYSGAVASGAGRERISLLSFGLCALLLIADPADRR
jgi:hypothetical protein